MFATARASQGGARPEAKLGGHEGQLIHPGFAFTRLECALPADAVVVDHRKMQQVERRVELIGQVVDQFIETVDVLGGHVHSQTSVGQEVRIFIQGLQVGEGLRIRPERLDLRSVVERTAEVARVLAGERNIDLHTPSSALWMEADPRRLEQVVLNLLTNAIKHAPATTPIAVRLRKSHNQAVLEVEDQGPGIPDIGQAMQYGYSTRRGLGVGLPGAKLLMDEFDIVSQVGIGTTITMKKWLE